MNGPTGLKYESLREVWQRLRVPLDKRDDAFADVQMLEMSALGAMHEKTED